MAHSVALRKFCALIAFLIAAFVVSPEQSYASAFEAFIPPKYKGVVLAAPVPMYPHTFFYIPGRVGVYRMKVNQQTGAVTEIGVLKRPEPGPGVGDANAAVILALLKWKFKPASIKQIDLPVEFDQGEIRPELKNAASQ